MAESYKFEAEINQLMNLIINAFYSNKDVFLRELISNASDALDKIRYKSLVEGKEVLNNYETFEIKITPDLESKTLTIQDTGVGMTKQDLINNLGTVARSGTKSFIESMVQKEADINMIGQFGVGFYSAYLVGNLVEVVTKHNDDRCYKWSSDAGGEFTIEEWDEPDLVRGTKIIIHIKDDDSKYLDETTVKNIVEKHSNYITYPISLYVTKTREVEVENDEEEENNNENEEDDKPKIEEVNEDDDENDDEPEKKTVTETYHEFDQINVNKPLWSRDPKEVTEEEYKEFYKGFSNDYQDYMLVKHFRVEGNLEFSGVMFVPEMAPFDMFESKSKNKGVKLHVRRVFITDDCKDLMPEYLGFVKGIVDSNDLPLNVSREMLQSTSIMRAMKKHIVKKCIEMITDCATEEPEKFNKFWDQYNKNIKLGIHEDDDNREKLVKLLRYYSTNHKEEMISLDTYISEMKEGQEDIYFITGESIQKVEDSPFMEALTDRGYDVMFLTDPIDEYAAQKVKTYEGRMLVDISKEGLDLDKDKKDDENEESEKEEPSKEYEELCKFMKEELGNRVEKVVVSKRITKSPCALATGQFGWSANMERIMKAQALGNDQMMMYMGSRKTMEINPNNKLVNLLKNRYEKDGADKTVKDLTMLLFETASLASGFSLDKPVEYTNRIYRMLTLGLSPEDFDMEEEVNVETNDETNEPIPNLENEETGESVMEQVD